jgi:hypothetical protein
MLEELDMAKYKHKIQRQLSLTEFNLYIDPYIPYGKRGANPNINGMKYLIIFSMCFIR